MVGCRDMSLLFRCDNAIPVSDSDCLGFGLGRSMFTVSLALALPAAVMCLASAVATPIMRRLGAKQTMLLGVFFGRSGFGLAFAPDHSGTHHSMDGSHGSPAALAGSAVTPLASERVTQRPGHHSKYHL